MPVPLAELVAQVQAGHVNRPEPTLLLRSDGRGLLYEGMVHAIVGEPETGKGWVVLCEGARLLRVGLRVLYVDFEDSPENIVTRLLALGAPAAAVAERFVYIRPDEVLLPGFLDDLLARGPYALAILDGMTEAYELMGLDYGDNKHIPRFLRALPRPLAEHGAAVVQVDHVTKNSEARGNWAIGGQHKKAGIPVQYGLQVIEHPSREKEGRSRLLVQKDRPGGVRGHAVGDVVAIVTITPFNGGKRVQVRFDPPAAGEGGEFRPTALMARASKFIMDEGVGVGLSKNKVFEGCKGNRAALLKAVDLLVDEGYVEVRKGKLHHAKPYKDEELSTGAGGSGSGTT
jgi:hypothetical protein